MNTRTKSTIAVRRALVVAGAIAALVAALAAPRDEAKAASSTCTARGIAVKRVVPYGTSLYALYTSTAPVKTWFGVYERGTQKTVAVGARWTLHQGTATSPATLGTPGTVELEAGETYNWVLTAEDAGGCRFYARGQATTLRRVVEVTFERPFVADDGDSTGSGELIAHARVHDTISQPLAGGVTLTAPAYLAVRHTMKVTGVPRSIKAHLRLVDDDHTAGFDHCGTVMTTGWGNGSNHCWDWATAVTTITAPPNGQPGSGTFSTGAIGGTVFTVTGSWKVTYVP